MESISSQSSQRFGVLGTGSVGESIATKLVSLGHQVMMGSRTKSNENAAKWAQKHTAGASIGTFQDTARFGEIIFLCTKGDATLSIIKSIPSDSLKGKIIIDVTNPLDFSKGMPPTLFVSNTSSLGEEIQNAIPQAHIVKTLNTANAEIMAKPNMVKETPTMFLCGNDAKAKEAALQILKNFGWSDIIDLGNLTSARAMEMLVIAWVKVYSALQTPHFAWKVIRKK